jgi:phage FluMu protein Com
MPQLACRSCGRQIYTVAPFESLFAEERRCPRCGAALNLERRQVERRTAIRREASFEELPASKSEDRRVGDRRGERRRKPTDGTPRSVGRHEAGWTD